MLEEDPNEKRGYHIGKDEETINTTMCNEFKNILTGEVSCVYVVGVLGLA